MSAVFPRSSSPWVLTPGLCLSLLLAPTSARAEGFSHLDLRSPRGDSQEPLIPEAATEPLLLSRAGTFSVPDQEESQDLVPLELAGQSEAVRIYQRAQSRVSRISAFFDKWRQAARGPDPAEVQAQQAQERAETYRGQKEELLRQDEARTSQGSGLQSLIASREEEAAQISEDPPDLDFSGSEPIPARNPQSFAQSEYQRREEEARLRIQNAAAPKPAPVRPAPQVEAPPPMAPARATNPGEYVVQPGDSLIGIARKVYNDNQAYTTIMQANGLHKNSILRVGDKLTIPDYKAPKRSRKGQMTARAEPEQKLDYVNFDYKWYLIKPGDSASELAERFYQDASKYKLIEAYNPKVKTQGLKVGGKLLIPMPKS